MTTATARANSNIALIKYWGKADPDLTIPTTSSLSLTLADTWTTTTVTFDGGAEGCDQVTINGTVPGDAARQRVVRFLDLVRDLSGRRTPATVTSTSTVPLAAGLASSAAGFAALAAAASRAAGLNLDPRALSRLARRGSGSASRSVFGGLVVWHAGSDDASSYAEPVSCPLDLAMVVMVVEAGPKPVSSTVAMRHTMQTSPLYPAWVAASADDLRQGMAAVEAGDLARLGEVAEANALGMHATMLAARPAVRYWLPSTVAVLHALAALRDAGWPVWATIDAGPNVKVLTSGSRAEQVAAELQDRFPSARLTVCRPGGGVEVETA